MIPKKSESAQLVVIGAGPGGYAAAFMAADLGLEVTMVDPAENPGGVCLYRGCIPSKTLLHVAKLLAETREAGKFGLTFAEPVIDAARLRAWKEDVVNRLTGGLGALTRHRGIRHLRGQAKFADASTLEVDTIDGEHQHLFFGHAIIASGSSATQLPGFDTDHPRIMDSTDALALEDIPKTMLLVGGGYIGLEMGTIYANLGTRVTVVERLPGLLTGADPDLVKVLLKRAGSLFADILLETTVDIVEPGDDAVNVVLKSKDNKTTRQTFDKVLLAVGRKPRSADLGLENTRISIDDHGFIEVDEHRCTAEPKIYAVGDVAGPPMLAHKASHEGRIAAGAIAGQHAAFEPRAMPAVVYTDPEIAYCGLTEQEAKERDIPYRIAKFPWAASGRALTIGREEGLTKMLIDPETERLLGTGIVGVGAGELISESVLAIEMGALATDIDMSIHPHPTLSETVMESASAYFGQSTHIYRASKPTP